MGTERQIGKVFNSPVKVRILGTQTTAWLEGKEKLVVRYSGYEWI